MKRLSVLIVSLLLIISLLSGCNNQAEVSDVLDKDSQVELSDTSEIVTENEPETEEVVVKEEVDSETSNNESDAVETSGENASEETTSEEPLEVEETSEEADSDATTEPTTSETGVAEEVVEMITLTINGPQEVGQFYTTSIPFVEGESAFDALHRVVELEGLYIEYAGSGRGAYVQGIEDYFEFDYGPVSGWLYSVNGEFPQVGVGRYDLSPSDQLIYHYTEDGGDDIKK